MPFMFRIALLSTVFALALHAPLAMAWGGPNKLLTMMDLMATQMGQTQELSEEKVEFYKDKVKELRQMMDNRLKEEGSLNPQKDKDLYDAINRYNQPLYDMYQKSKAKQLNDPHNVNR